MNCFYHPDTAAIGICKACQKGLCSQCANDLDHGLACKDKHETEVEHLHMMTEKNIKIYASAPKNILIAPLFFIFMGLVYAGYGYFSGWGITDIGVVLGMGFALFGIIIFVRNRAIFGKKTE